VLSQAATIGHTALDGLARINGILFRALGNSPRDVIGLFVALLAAVAILINALYMQPGPHPAPIFSVRQRPVADPVPVATVKARPEVAPAKTATRSRTEITSDIQRELSRRGLYDGPTDGVIGPKTDAAIRDFETSAKLRATGEPTEEILRAIQARPLKTEPVPVPRPAPRDPIADLIAPTPRVTAVQRALNDYGYGPVKATGLYGPETVAAIEKFERDRKMPVTGQISPRLMRELAALTGRPLE
jgi:peptidoglycan hydrolase-like protein with peptidoglycan-binding domain